MALPPTGFWSYTSADDAATRGRLSRLREILASELQQKVGRAPTVRIFQDKATIPPGHDWEHEIREALETSSFFIPILTPGFLQSEWCCREVRLFRDNMARRGRGDLIFPMHYIDVAEFQQARRGECADQAVHDFLRSLHWIEFRPLRLGDPDGEDVARCLSGLADGIRQALYRAEPRVRAVAEAASIASAIAAAESPQETSPGLARPPARRAMPPSRQRGIGMPWWALVATLATLAAGVALAIIGPHLAQWPSQQTTAQSKPATAQTAAILPSQPGAGTAAAPVAAPREAGTITDCDKTWCPVMVWVRPDSFTMGATAEVEGRAGMSEGQRGRASPAHKVTIVQGFYLGQFPVTRGEYAAFIADTPPRPPGDCATYESSDDDSEWGTVRAGRDWQNPGFVQTNNHPVVCVSYDDAKDYAQWLSSKTGKEYRLPTEAEWEYAARAGTTTARFWGGKTACDYANVADQNLAEQWKLASPDTSLFACRDGAAYTAPVDAHQANDFGLHDMLGNVAQWVADCWHRNYEGTPNMGNPPADGSAWKSGSAERQPDIRFAFIRRVGLSDLTVEESSFGNLPNALCEKFRVVRGASWLDEPSMVFAALRTSAPPGMRSSVLGFRLARMP